jgi:peptidyl-prolyl cis-trans isomerase D
MLSKFRGKTGSTIIFAFTAMAVVTMLTSTGGGGEGIASLIGLYTPADTVAKVGNESISQQGLVRLAERSLRQINQGRLPEQQATLAQLAASGGFTKLLNTEILTNALYAFARGEKMQVSDAQLDAEILKAPGMNDGGKINYDNFKRFIQSQGMDETGFRNYAKHQIVAQNLHLPIGAAGAMPVKLQKLYAGLLTDVREGEIGILPVGALVEKTPKPSEGEVSAYYNAHIDKFTLPERRVLEYAVFDKKAITAKAQPKPVEIDAYFKAHSEDYAAKDFRTLTQVITLDKGSADKIAAAAKSSSLAAAAKAAGLVFSNLGEQEKLKYASITANSVADQVFAAGVNSYVVAKSPLGWHVVHIDAANHHPAKTLEQVKPEIVKLLLPSAIERAYAEFQTNLNAKASKATPIAALAHENNVTLVTTPLIIANGVPVSDTGAVNNSYHPTAEVAQLLSDGFKADINPKSDSILTDFAQDPNKKILFHVKQLMPKLPLPLTQVHDAALKALWVEKATAATKAQAEAVQRQVNGGATLAAALQKTGLKLPPVQKVNYDRLHLMADGRVPQAITALFKAVPHRAKVVLESANGSPTYFVVVLNGHKAVDPSTAPIAIQQAAQLASGYGDNLFESFANGAKAKIGTKTYPEAIKAVNDKYLEKSQ